MAVIASPAISSGPMLPAINRSVSDTMSATWSPDGPDSGGVNESKIPPGVSRSTLHWLGSRDAGPALCSPDRGLHAVRRVRRDPRRSEHDGGAPAPDAFARGLY